MNIPKDLLYSDDHEWVRVDGDLAYVGITDFAQHNMGDIVYVEMPDVDDEIEAGSQIGVIESVKAVSSMFTPVSGTISEVNGDLEGSPEMLNAGPYENYIIIVKMKNKDELSNLLSPEKYEKLCEEAE